MSAIADLVTFLNSSGISVEFHGKIIDIAMQHGIEQMGILRNSTEIPRNSVETVEERRKRKDRERKRIPRNSMEEKKGGSLTSFSEETLQEEEVRKKEESKKERAREAELLQEGFGLFWGRWPNRVGKSAALKAYRSALKRSCHAEIMAGVENYIRDKPPDRHWLNPATFFNQDRWSDQPAQVIHGTFKTNSGGSLTASLKRDLAALEQSEGADFALPAGRILRLSN
jgi:hypothetical protein